MLNAIKCALYVYSDKYVFNAMRKSAMESDFSWKRSSKEYLKMYHEITGK